METRASRASALKADQNEALPNPSILVLCFLFSVFFVLRHHEVVAVSCAVPGCVLASRSLSAVYPSVVAAGSAVSADYNEALPNPSICLFFVLFYVLCATMRCLFKFPLMY